MKLHLGSIGDHAQTSILVEHFDPTSVPTDEDMKNKKEHNQAMLEIASALSYAEFDDIKGCKTTYKMWKAYRPYMEEIIIYKDPSQRALEEILMTLKWRKVIIFLSMLLE